uniref:Uncharacterized protein n=1 Tax=Corethron hystrix TaxID=216773 RepID=A0A7S1BKB1_9STRA|mmetsp:Transcript_29012/g.66390  ORF Transcript_29012/g.66390 Transcript_29012/m.66390 type:complete len:112 (+) Transcript_29012:70-405(+)
MMMEEEEERLHTIALKTTSCALSVQLQEIVQWHDPSLPPCSSSPIAQHIVRSVSPAPSSPPDSKHTKKEDSFIDPTVFINDLFSFLHETYKTARWYVDIFVTDSSSSQHAR